MFYNKQNFVNFSTPLKAEQLIAMEDGIIAQENHFFENKTVSFYGDSLTEKNQHYSKGYYEWMQEILGFASYNNYGKSGFTLGDIYDKINTINDTADCIFVMGGTNDQTWDVNLGEWGDTIIGEREGYPDSSKGSSYGSIYSICSLLKTKYPTKFCMFITPHFQNTYKHDDGVTTNYDISKAIKQTCEKFAIPVYDNYVYSGIYTPNLSSWTTDGCHWNDKAHEMVGKNISQYLLSNFACAYKDVASQ